MRLKALDRRAPALPQSVGTHYTVTSVEYCKRDDLNHLE
jgi:hypothetical protein